ncbi:hypothetical protein FKM82_004932 [Ascaphus truei]
MFNTRRSANNLFLNDGLLYYDIGSKSSLYYMLKAFVTYRGKSLQTKGCALNHKGTLLSVPTSFEMGYDSNAFLNCFTNNYCSQKPSPFLS